MRCWAGSSCFLKIEKSLSCWLICVNVHNAKSCFDISVIEHLQIFFSVTISFIDMVFVYYSRMILRPIGLGFSMHDCWWLGLISNFVFTVLSWITFKSQVFRSNVSLRFFYSFSISSSSFSPRTLNRTTDVPRCSRFRKYRFRVISKVIDVRRLFLVGRTFR